MRDKLFELLRLAPHEGRTLSNWIRNDSIKGITDYLIAHGVTFADVPDTNVVKWIPVSERLPEIFAHVLVQIPGEKPFVTVHEGWRNPYGGWNADGFTRESDEVTHWMPMPEFHSKEEQNVS